MYGMKPIAEMQYSDFMFPATNQIISEARKSAIVPITTGAVRRDSCADRRRNIRRIVSFPVPGIGFLRNAGIENRCAVLGL